jgi:hypothetical protein
MAVAVDDDHFVVGAILSSMHIAFFRAADKLKMIAVYPLPGMPEGLWYSRAGQCWVLANKSHTLEIFTLEELASE